MPVCSQSHLEAVVGERYHRRMLALLRPLVTPELVDEHRRSPLGQPGDALQRILNYLGSLPIDGKLIVEHDGADQWFVSRLVGFPPTGAQRLQGPLATEGDAVHAVFRRRLIDVFGIEPGP